MPAVTSPTRIKVQTILFATDFSPSAQSALDYALNLARSYEAAVYSVNVLPHLPFVETTQPDPEQIRLQAKQRMTELAGSESFRGIRHKELIQEGEIPDVISKLVKECDVDVIVIGTGGRKRLEKLLLGSVAEEIFRNAQCPVITVGPHATHWETHDLRHILFATDFGPESIHALPYAVSLAEENRARLTLLHVAAPPIAALLMPEPANVPVCDREEVVASAEKQLRALIPDPTRLWHEPDYKIQFGAPSETIVKAAGETTDMIVLGVKRATMLTKHLTTGVAYKVACEVHCAVLSVGSRFRV